MSTLTTHRNPNLVWNDPFFNRFFNTTLKSREQEQRFAPALDIYHSDDAYIIEADLPGVSEEDLDITVHEGVLTVAGTRAGREESENESYRIRERQSGSFQRAFTLPTDAEQSAVEAEMKKGVLTIRINKKEQSKPRKIAVKR